MLKTLTILSLSSCVRAAGKVDSRKPDRELLARLSSIVEGKIRRFSPTTASRQVARDPKPCSRPVD